MVISFGQVIPTPNIFFAVGEIIFVIILDWKPDPIIEINFTKIFSIYKPYWFYLAIIEFKRIRFVSI